MQVSKWLASTFMLLEGDKTSLKQNLHSSGSSKNGNNSSKGSNLNQNHKSWFSFVHGKRKKN